MTFKNIICYSLDIFLFFFQFIQVCMHVVINLSTSRSILYQTIYLNVTILNILVLFSELRVLNPDISLFTYQQINSACNNFNIANKIGEGGFGSVYKVCNSMF